MALFRSSTVTAASGSIGGLTFLPTRAGMAFRAKANPVDPRTPRQIRIRRAFAFLVYNWTNSLTSAQRARWANYAKQISRPGTLERSIHLTPLQTYIRNQMPRLVASFQVLPATPTVYTTGGFTPVAITTYPVAPFLVGIFFDETDPWVTTFLAAMLIFISRPQNPTAQSPNKSYRFAGRIIGTPFGSPTSPQIRRSPFRFFRGQRIFVRITVTYPDGRYSEAQTLTTIAL